MALEKVWIGCAAPNFSRGRRENSVPEAIVIHIIVGSLASADNTFTNDHLDKVRSAHYGVGKTGVIHQYVAEEDTAFHAGEVVEPSAPYVKDTKRGINPNRYTIGIEHEGVAETPWTLAMFESSAQLIAEIAGRWSIPVTRERVLMHREIKAIKSCPGTWLNINDLVTRAAKIRATPPPANRVTVGFPRAANVTRAVRLRGARPSTTSPVLSVLQPGTSISVSALVTGDAVANGTSWWCEVGNAVSYFWAGASDLVLPG
jgi:hypothetical protein